MLPKAAIAGGGSASPPAPANTPYTFTLNKGQQAQFTQQADLTGSIISATSPIGFMAGHPCMHIPVGTNYCDHGEQMLPPVKALGNEYVGVMYRPRVPGDKAIWRLVGAVDGTQLTYSRPRPPARRPRSRGADGRLHDRPALRGEEPGHDAPLHALHLHERRQLDAALQHQRLRRSRLRASACRRSSTSSNYVFFTDPTYPETNLVVVRAPDAGQRVRRRHARLRRPAHRLAAVGSYQWTRVDLETRLQRRQRLLQRPPRDDEQGPVRPLGVGLGHARRPAPHPANVSYGYPGGMNVEPINPVVIPPVAK